MATSSSLIRSFGVFHGTPHCTRNGLGLALAHLPRKSLHKRPSRPRTIVSRTSVEHINSDEDIQFVRILSHATKVPGLIFLSGQTPIDKSGKLVEGGIQEHTAQCIKNLGNVLTAAGSSWEKVVKVNVYLKDMDKYNAMNKVYEKMLPSPKPARTCIQAGKLPNDVDIEIEAIAAY